MEDVYEFFQKIFRSRVQKETQTQQNSGSNPFSQFEEVFQSQRNFQTGTGKVLESLEDFVKKEVLKNKLYVRSVNFYSYRSSFFFKGCYKSGSASKKRIKN